MDKWDQVTGYCCDTCRYFSHKGPNDIGRCRRNAPTMSGYPVVYGKTDWCGDHKIGTNPDKKANEPKAGLSGMGTMKNPQVPPDGITFGE